jgi:hypothetical protein
MLHLNLLGAQILLDRLKTKNHKAFWDNYDLIIWKKDANGYTQKDGMFLNEWGTVEKVSVNKEGIWKLPKKYVRYFK